MSNNITNSGESDSGSEPPFFTPFQPPLPVTLTPRRRNLTAVSLFSEGPETLPPNHAESEAHNFDCGSDSSKSETDTPAELLCSICDRRPEGIRFEGCGHRACSSCTKKVWWSRINRPDRARDPWPASIPCPFCRAEVTAVVDEREVSSSLAQPVNLIPGSWDEAEIDFGFGADTDVDSRGILIVDWMVRNSKSALERLRRETEAHETTAK